MIWNNHGSEISHVGKTCSHGSAVPLMAMACLVQGFPLPSHQASVGLCAYVFGASDIKQQCSIRTPWKRRFLGKLWYFTNLNCSAIWGWFPLLTMIPVRSQWGRYNLPRHFEEVASIDVLKIQQLLHSSTFLIGWKRLIIPVLGFLNTTIIIGSAFFWCMYTASIGYVG